MGKKLFSSLLPNYLLPLSSCVTLSNTKETRVASVIVTELLFMTQLYLLVC